MKKRMIWIVFASFFLLTACGALAAGEIVLPDPEALDRVTVTASQLELTVSDRNSIAWLLEALGQARNTGKASVQDVPDKGTGLVRFDFRFREGGASTAFLYSEGGKLFLEQPYQGIWELDGSLAAMLRRRIGLELSRTDIFS